MIILRPTVKLAAHLALGPLADLAPTSDPYADWCVRSFPVGRIPYLLFSNTPSLFSVVVPRRGVVDRQTMFEVMGMTLGRYLNATGHGDLFEKRVAPQLDECAWARNRERSIVGSMNELAFLAAAYLEPMDLDITEVHCRLNSAPMGALQMDSRPRFSPRCVFQSESAAQGVDLFRGAVREVCRYHHFAPG